MSKDLQLEICERELGLSRAIEHFKSVISMAELALKNAILINGGAAIALLTFIGNKPTQQNLIIAGLFIFSVGVLFGAFATFCAYLAQNAFMNRINSQQDFIENPWQKIAAIILCFSSYIAFAGGIFSVGAGFICQNTL